MTGSGPDLRCAIAHQGISRLRVRFVLLAPRNDGQFSAAFSHSEIRSEIRGDALVLPIAVPRGFRTLRTLKLLRHWPRTGFRGLPARFGLGKRALRSRRQRLAFPLR